VCVCMWVREGQRERERDRAGSGSQERKALPHVIRRLLCRCPVRDV